MQESNQFIFLPRLSGGMGQNKAIVAVGPEITYFVCRETE